LPAAEPAQPPGAVTLAPVRVTADLWASPLAQIPVA
jgi:hypothetical protein